MALQNASPKSLVVVFTDNGSKDLMLERDIVRLRKTKEIEVESWPDTCDYFPGQYSGLSNTYIAQVFIVLTPAYEGRLNGPSLPAFSRMGKVCSMFQQH